LLGYANAIRALKPVEDLLTATNTAGKHIDEFDPNMITRIAVSDPADLSDIERRGVWTELADFHFRREASSASRSAAGFVT